MLAALLNEESPKMDEAMAQALTSVEIGDLLTRGGVTLELVHGDELLCNAVAVRTRMLLRPLFGVAHGGERSQNGFGRAVGATSKHHGSHEPTVQLDRSAHNRVVGSSAVAPATMCELATTELQARRNRRLATAY
jgi:hypothetical protein